MDRFLKNNTVLRIIALVLSCILWVTVNMPNSGSNGTYVGAAQEKQFPFSVRLLTDANETVTSIDNPTAVIVVRGDALNLMALPAQMMGVSVVADARGLGPGKHVVKLSAAGVPTANYTVDPATVTVTLEPKETSQRNVHVKVQGSPASGYRTGDAVVDLPSIQISGPKSDVDAVAHLEASVSIEGAKQTVTKTVHIVPVDRNDQLVPDVMVNPANVTVTVPVQAPYVTATIVPQVVGQPQTGFAVANVAVSPGLVLVYGSPSELTGVTAMNVPVDVTGLSSTQTMQIDLPSRPGLTKLVPKTITVVVRIEPSATRTFTGLPIQIENVPPDMHAVFSGASAVDITVTGPKSTVSRLQTQDVKVLVNAANAKTGANELPIAVTPPNWVQVTQMSIHTATVTLTR